MQARQRPRTPQTEEFPIGICVITGGSRGIGAAPAEAVARSGWDVVLSYRVRQDEAERVAATVRDVGQRAIAVRADVSNESDVERLFATATEELGPITGVVNNAGVVPAAGRVDAYSAARVSDLFKINVVGAFIVAREAVRRMSTAHDGAGGVLVNVSSRAAVLGGACEYVDYAASKAALDALTVGLALEVALEGIEVQHLVAVLADQQRHAVRCEAPARLLP